MLSPIRKELHTLMKQYSDAFNLQGEKILDVGILGDPRPSDNHQFFGQGNTFKTMDVLPEAEADYTQDICDTNFKDNEWDFLILSQTLEHIYNYKKALKEVKRIAKKAMITTPMNEFHGEPNMPDYWRFTHQAYEKMLPELGYRIIHMYHTPGLVSVIANT